MPEGHGAEHDVLAQLLRLGLDHQHALGGAGEHQIELAGGQLGGGGVQDVGTGLVAHAGGGDGAEERDAGEGERRRAADHGDHVRVVLHVMAEHGGDHLDLVAEALREQRADRAVDEAGGEDLLLGGPALALEKATRDLAGGEGLLLVVDRQREEVLPGLRGADADGGAEDDGVAVAGEHGAVGLAGHLAGLEHEGASAPLDFLAEVIEHMCRSLRVPGSEAGPLGASRATRGAAATPGLGRLRSGPGGRRRLGAWPRVRGGCGRARG